MSTVTGNIKDIEDVDIEHLHLPDPSNFRNYGINCLNCLKLSVSERAGKEIRCQVRIHLFSGFEFFRHDQDIFSQDPPRVFPEINPGCIVMINK